jgi:hypothetical protein
MAALDPLPPALATTATSPYTPRIAPSFSEQFVCALTDPTGAAWKEDSHTHILLKIKALRVIISYMGKIPFIIQQRIIAIFMTRSFSDIRGLPNFDGILRNVCFMNALFQIFANTELINDALQVATRSTDNNRELTLALNNMLNCINNPDSTDTDISSHSKEFYQALNDSESWKEKIGDQNDSLELLHVLLAELGLTNITFTGAERSTNTVYNYQTMQTEETIFTPQPRASIPVDIRNTNSISEALISQYTTTIEFRYYHEDIDPAKSEFKAPRAHDVFSWHLAKEGSPVLAGFDITKVKEFQVCSVSTKYPENKYYHEDLLQLLGKSYPKLQEEYCRYLTGDNIARSTTCNQVRINQETRVLSFSIDNPKEIFIPEETLVLNGTEYELCGTINKPGAHYTSCIKKNGRWMLCNDSKVSRLTGVNTDNIRGVFYRRKTGL